ncbi:MAG: amidohydrolase [Myxococcota bacterium]
MLLPLLACRPAVPECDAVWTGGVVHTMEPGAPPAEAVGARDGAIAVVGSAEDVAACTGEGTRVEDLGGRVLLPGFVDAHTHPVWSGAELLTVDLYEVTTIEEALAAVAAYAASHPEEAWIQGGGWDAPTFEGQLHRSQLDGVVADRPVFLASADGHSAWVNSEALAEAGVTADTPDPDGGAIERDEAGEPTDVLRETAVDLVAAYAPAYSDALVDEGLALALAEVHAYGITTLIDANAEDWVLAAYLRADAAGTLGVRVFGAVEALPGEGAGQIDAIVAMRAEYASPLVSVGAIKVYLDGVLESQTGYLLEPYEDGSNGEPLFDDAELDAIFAAADEAGLQLHAHAIGDGAVRQLLDAVERIPGTRDRRPLAAHIELIDPLDVPRFAELGVLADFQPLWAYPDEYIVELTVPVIGEDRAGWLYPIGGVAAAGGTLVAGSDWSVSSMNPWEAVEVAVTRQDPEGGGDVLTPDQRVDVDTILAAYTRDGARAVFAEDAVGSIAVGKRADLVLVDRDPWEVDASELSDVRVLATWVDGGEVFRDDGTGASKRARPRR